MGIAESSGSPPDARPLPKDTHTMQHLRLKLSLVALAAISMLAGCVVETRAVPARTVYVQSGRTVVVEPARTVIVEPVRPAYVRSY